MPTSERIEVPLLYNGREVSVAPLGKSFRDTLTGLRENNRSRVVLEPGDATRYMLQLFRPTGDANLIYVIRVAGGWSPAGYPVGVALIDTDNIQRSDLMALASGNDWTLEIIFHFLITLFGTEEG